MSAAIFAVYIKFGDGIDLGTAFTVLTVLNLIKDPLRSLPLFVGQFIEFTISMQRISDFIMVEEINESIVQKLDHEVTQESVDIRRGTFHWGPKLAKDDIKPGKKKDKKKEKEEKEKKEKEKLK